MPPIRSGSTLRVASTLRPEACSICSTSFRASASESSTAVVSSTVDRPLVLGDQPLELAGDLLQQAAAALVREQQHEVADELVGALEQVLQRRGLRTRVELRVAQQLAQLGHVGGRLRELGETGANLIEPALVERRVEQRPRVDAVHDAH